MRDAHVPNGSGVPSEVFSVKDCEPEIRDFAVPRSVEQDVVGFEIAVHEPQTVKVLEAQRREEQEAAAAEAAERAIRGAAREAEEKRIATEKLMSGGKGDYMSHEAEVRRPCSQHSHRPKWLSSLMRCCCSCDALLAAHRILLGSGTASGNTVRNTATIATSAL